MVGSLFVTFRGQKVTDRELEWKFYVIMQYHTAQKGKKVRGDEVDET